MSFGKFFGFLLAMFVGVMVLVWVFVSAAALVYALTEEDGRSAPLYAGFTVGGLVVAALLAWGTRAVVKSRRPRQ